jgi:ribosomal protein L21E
MKMYFEPGERVRLSDRVFHPNFRGLTGTVKRTVKTRQIVEVLLDNGEEYGARPENLEAVS